MANSNLSDVLDGIVDLTSERDSTALELSLAQTLFTLADIENIFLHTVGNIKRVKHAKENAEALPENNSINSELVDALFEALTTAKTINILHKNKNMTLFPILCSKKHPLAVVLVEQTENTVNHELTIIKILNIYHNFLALMNENERDTLTGLLNRRTFDLKVNQLISDLQQAKKMHHIISDVVFLAIFDIDHFKRINDKHGHLIGDEVLLLFSHLMEKTFRDVDILFRFGGEEFVGLFKCPNSQTMATVLNYFREHVETYAFPQVGQVTVSCGFTKVDEYDISCNIIDRADVALYHAKNNGRNQACQHEILVALDLLAEEDISGGEIELS